METTDKPVPMCKDPQGEPIKWRHRTHDEARAALRDFCDVAWGHRTRKDGSSINIFTIPRDERRDADCILYDVLAERDSLIRQLKIYGSHFPACRALQHVGMVPCDCGLDAVIAQSSDQKEGA